MKNQDNITSNEVIPSNQSQPLLYSSAVNRRNLPQMNHAIVIDLIDGNDNREYILALILKTYPVNIPNISRISKNRFC